MPAGDQAKECPRCGTRKAGKPDFCPVCGFEFTVSNTQAKPDAPRSVFPNSPAPGQRTTGTLVPVPCPVAAPPLTPEAGQPFDVRCWFGFRTVSGTVLAVEPPQMAPRETSAWGWLGKLLLLPVLIGAGAAFMLIKFSFSLFDSSARGARQPGFASNIGNQVTSYVLFNKLFGPKEQVPVQSVRVRDSCGQEHQVQIRGDLYAGHLTPGDDVELEGYDRRGTLILARGWNKRTRSEIIVKRR